MLFVRKFVPAIAFSCLLWNVSPISAAPPPPAYSPTQFAALLKLAPTLAPQALQAALTALKRVLANGAKVRSDVITVIDYTKSSTEHRLWVFDLAHTRVLFDELAAHGRNSGDNLAMRFSNAPDSLMTSLGVFLTGETYIGKHGLSLRLEGLEKGFNDNSMARAIVLHAADYVSDAIATATGRIGRSWGCPAVRPEISRRLIQTLQGGSLILAYYPDSAWMRNSKLAGLDGQVSD
ncbi:MAG: murein L,D-transpeptidase catalytic domain family protein [Bryobacteraceae bacterium]